MNFNIYLKGLQRVLIWLLAACSCAVMHLQAGNLPKVRVAADGTCLELEGGHPFFPVGVNYFRPGTGWPPQLWKQFDPAAVKEDFKRLSKAGFNCVRVFLTFGSFYSEPGRLSEEGLRKFDLFLELAEESGIYVHPTGPDHWEGLPHWAMTDRVADFRFLEYIEQFWRLFARRYRGRNAILAYDLLNEPSVAWKGPHLEQLWPIFRMTTPTEREGCPEWPQPMPLVEQTQTGCSVSFKQMCSFREWIATEWVRRQAAAIRQADPGALVTVGLIQWSVPVYLPASTFYSGFRVDKIAPYLDFIEVHFYPLAGGAYQYGSLEAQRRQLAYLRSVARYLRTIPSPVVLAEFGWYGGGPLVFDKNRWPEASEEAQAGWGELVLRVTEGLCSGWLNWALYDHPEAQDVTQRSGLWTSDGRAKRWGEVFAAFARQVSRWNCADVRRRATEALKVPWPRLDFDRALCDESYRDLYLEQATEALHSFMAN